MVIARKGKDCKLSYPTGPFKVFGLDVQKYDEVMSRDFVLRVSKIVS